jgi:hypothetical protein
MPHRLMPVFMAFFLDAIGTGMTSPFLPFLCMEFDANAIRLGPSVMI